MPKDFDLPLLHVHSHYSYLEGIDRPEDLVREAAHLGYRWVALTDRASLSGGVRFVKAAQREGVVPVLGCVVAWHFSYPQPAGEEPLLLLAEGPKGYGHLSQLLTEVGMRDRRRPTATLEVLQAHRQGVYALVGLRRGALAKALLAGDFLRALAIAQQVVGVYGRAQVFLALEKAWLPGEVRLEERLEELARHLGLEQVAVPPVYHRRREDVWLHDLVTCVREGISVDVPSPQRPLNAEAYLLSREEWERRYAHRPDAVAAAVRLAERLAAPYAVPPPRPRLPRALLPPGLSPEEALHRAVEEGVAWRYGPSPPHGLWERLRHELDILCDLGYAEYFLVVQDVVRYARSAGIRVAGRGSAADSAVAYVLGITEVDAFRRGLLFERFLSRERGERPDIDLDLDARRREEVAAYVRRRYGEDHVAAVGTFSTFRIRSAVRELGKALGFPLQEMARLSRSLPDVAADDLLPSWPRYPELAHRHEERRRYRLLWKAAAALAGAPRFPGTHLGGLVVAAEPVAHIAPLFEAAKGGPTMALDKDDVEDLGLMKLDLLSLRTLSALERAESLSPGATAQVQPDDPQVYQRIRRGETIGMFQLESPAQRALQARLGAQRLEDLVHSVALIRPGPIQGNMVDPYVARRRGEEPVTFLHPLLEPILARTYGVVLFQEQVIEIAVRLAGFTPGEADQLRRVMTHGRSRAEMARLGETFVERAVARGVDAATAQAVFAQLEGYASYGFSEAHAAAFAQTAYQTAYLLEHKPAVFFASLLSEQPMGYYPPWVLVTEARRRGISFLPVDVNRSLVGCTVEEGRIRLGLSLVSGLGEEGAQRVVEARPPGGYRGVADLRARTGLAQDQLEQLVRAGALDSVTPHRRAALWECAGPSGQHQLPLMGPPEEDFPAEEKRRMEVEVLGLEWRGSVWAEQRPLLRRQGYTSSQELRWRKEGERVRCVGWPLRPHRPPTRSGRPAAFFSLVDEGGLVDCVLFGEAYARYGEQLFGRSLPPLEVEGRVQVRGEGRAVVALRVSPWKGGLGPQEDPGWR